MNKFKNLLTGFKTLCGYYHEQRLLLSLDLLAILLYAGLQIAIPVTALKVFNVYLPEGDLRATAWAALAFTLMTVCAAGLEWCYILFGH